MTSLDDAASGSAAVRSRGRAALRGAGLLALTAALPVALLAAAANSAKPRFAAGRAAAPPASTTAHLLAALAVVLVAAHLGGRLARLLRQPAVIGEICAGLALGPSLLGHFVPAAYRGLFPAAVTPVLKGVAELGLVLFVFEVGRGLAVERPPGSAARILSVCVASMLLPFAAGAWLAGRLPAGYAGPVGDGRVFAIFLGCALSVTAVPVLARLLTDLRLASSEVGRLSIFAAATGDCGSWILVTVALGGAHGSMAGAGGRVLLESACAAALLLGPVRWAARRAAAATRGAVAAADDLNADDGSERLDAARGGGWGVEAALVVGVLASAALTAAIGVHEIAGAFLAGLACPVGRPRIDLAVRRLGAVSRSLLLPVFFVVFGLSVDLTALPITAGTLAAGAALLAAACVTKLLGPSLCARLTGLDGRSSAALGALLNARGLTELVIIQIGYQAGLIGGRLYALLTVITLITTAAAGPLLRLVRYEDHADQPRPPRAGRPPKPRRAVSARGGSAPSLDPLFARRMMHETWRWFGWASCAAAGAPLPPLPIRTGNTSPLTGPPPGWPESVAAAPLSPVERQLWAQLATLGR